MAYGNLLTDVVQSSTTNTPPVFKDGNGTQVGTLCRAWVNFNGTSGSVGSRASFNVTSVTRNGTGDYTVSFTTAMPDANYAVTMNGPNNVGTDTTVTGAISASDLAAGTFRIDCETEAAAQEDSALVCAAVFR